MRVGRDFDTVRSYIEGLGTARLRIFVLRDYVSGDYTPRDQVAGILYRARICQGIRYQIVKPQLFSY
jgi:hypothetical protein